MKMKLIDLDLVNERSRIGFDSKSWDVVSDAYGYDCLCRVSGGSISEFIDQVGGVWTLREVINSSLSQII
jgi:hypothetical protein